MNATHHLHRIFDTGMCPYDVKIDTESSLFSSIQRRTLSL